MARTPFKKSIKNVYQRFVNYSLGAAIITFIIGLVLVFLPDVSNRIVGALIGISCIGSGASSLYNYLKRDGAKLFALSIVFAVFYFLLGLILIIYPYKVMSFVTICLGLYLIVKGAMKIDYAFWFKRGSEDSWLVTLVTGILLIVFGILLLVDPFARVLTLTKIAGAFLMINAVMDFSNTIMFKKRTKVIMDIFW